MRLNGNISTVHTQNNRQKLVHLSFPHAFQDAAQQEHYRSNEQVAYIHIGRD